MISSRGIKRGIRLGPASLALLLATGAAAQQVSEQWAFKTGGVVNSSPALAADGTIYVGSEDGSVYAIPPSGNPRKWIFSPPDAPSFDSSPAVGPDGTIYIGADDGSLYAINPATGAEKWPPFRTSQGENGIFSSPAIGADGTIYVGAGDHNLHAVNPDGSPKWQFPTGDEITGSPAIGPDGTIYVGSLDNSLYAVNPDGSLKWRYPTLDNIASTPAIGADGTIYIGSRDGNLYALTPGGNPKWAFAADGPVDTAPAIGADGTLYFGSKNGTFYAVKSVDGTQLWSYKATPGVAIFSNAAIRSDGTIIFGTGSNDPPGPNSGLINRVIALNPDGSLLWPTPPLSTDSFDSSPAIAPNGTIYIGSADFHLYAINGNALGLAATPWPLFHHDLARTGRAASAPPPSDPGRLVNLSVLSQIGPDNPILTLGFVTGGTGTSGSQTVLLRGTGPALTQFGVAGILADPALTLLNGSMVTAANDNWGSPTNNAAAVTAADSAVFAFPLNDQNSLDAALVEPLTSAGYTIQISGHDNDSGYTLAEVYDATPPGTYTASQPRLINLSSQTNLPAGSIMTAGFIVGGSTPETVLIRATGPALLSHGVTGVLSDPELELFNGQDTKVATDAGWGAEPLTVSSIVYDSAKVGAFQLASGSTDSAVLITLDPGAYTVQVSSASGMNSGVTLIEVYEIP